MKVLAGLSCILLAGALAYGEDVLTNGDFQDLDAWDVTYSGQEVWLIDPTDEEPDSLLDYWYSHLLWDVDGPGNGDQNNWYARHFNGTNSKIGQVVEAPPTGSVMTLSFDYILEPGHYAENAFYVQGLNDGEALNLWVGGLLEGVQIGSHDLADTAVGTWGSDSFEVVVDDTYQYIGVVAVFSASAAGTRGIDNVVLDVAASAGTPGDADGDGVVDLTDLGILATNWGRTDVAVGAAEGDFDDSGTVDLSDLGILATNWGTGTQAVPEPATMSLLGLGGLALLKRTRKS